MSFKRLFESILVVSFYSLDTDNKKTDRVVTKLDVKDVVNENKSIKTIIGTCLKLKLNMRTVNPLTN